MAEITSQNGRTIVDYMARDYESFLLSMEELIPDLLPEWTDYKDESDFGRVLLQLFADTADKLSYYQDRVANESFLGTAQTRRSIIHHLKLIGYRLATAAPASTTMTLTLPGDCTEIIEISKGDAFATKSQKDKPSVRFEYTREASITIDCNTLPVDSEGKKNYEGIPVEEGRLVSNELLGESDGKPNQSFTLANPELILRSLGEGQQINRDIILITELGEGPGMVIEDWSLRESLAFSREGQRDYIIEIDDQNRATIIFGDGAFGAIPTRGAIIKVTYRVGGGTQGNAAANTIQTIVDAPQLSLLAATVTNPNLSTGGAERESIDNAVLHAPTVFRSLKRAVTGDDYKALALDFKGVGKVRAEATSWNVVDLFVAPEGGGHVSDVLRANLLAYFEDKRPISTIIEVKDVDYVKIYVTAEIGVKSYYDTDEVREQVEQAASDLLTFDNVDFGQIIYLSKFYEAIEGIEGISFANITEFRQEDDRADTVESAGKIELGVNEIPRTPTDPNDDPDYAGGIKVVIPEEGS